MKKFIYKFYICAEILNVKTKIPKTWSGKQSDIPKISLD